jgi:hypothetical protein
MGCALKWHDNMCFVIHTNGLFPIRNLDSYVTYQLVSNSVVHNSKNCMHWICITLFLILSGWTRLYMAAIIKVQAFWLASQCDKTSSEFSMNYLWVRTILRICSHGLNGSVTCGFRRYLSLKPRSHALILCKICTREFLSMWTQLHICIGKYTYMCMCKLYTRCTYQMQIYFSVFLGMWRGL